MDVIPHIALSWSLVIILISGVWALVWLSGGTGNAVPHLMYVPVLYATVRIHTTGGVITALVGGLAMASLPIMRDQDEVQSWLPTLVRTASYVAAALISGRALQSLKERTEQLKSSVIESVAVLVSTIEANHRYTAGHTTRVSEVSRRLGVALGLPEPQLNILTTGSLLHDIGKVAVPLAILDKPGRLTEAEFETVKQHPVVGHTILSRFKYPGAEGVRDIVRHHHERLDGSGYPDGLRGDQLSLLARIVAVADVYEALTSDRSYRPGMSSGDALGIIERDAEAGLFDPRVVLELRRLVEAGRV